MAGARRGPECDGRGGRGSGVRTPALRDLLLAGLLVHDLPRPGPLHLCLPAALKADAAPWQGNQILLQKTYHCHSFSSAMDENFGTCYMPTYQQEMVVTTVLERWL